jgi:hypothetical protein
MSTIDTTVHYLVQSTFFPGKGLTLVNVGSPNGSAVELTPSPTSLAQYWTECWAFRPIPGSNGYTITSLSSGPPNCLGVVSDRGNSDDGTLVYGSFGLNWQWQVVPLPGVTSTVVTLGTNGAYGWGGSSSWWLTFALSGSLANYANVQKNNNFSFQKYWTLTKTAIKV